MFGDAVQQLRRGVLPISAAVLLGAPACTTFTSVEEACHPSGAVPGTAEIGPVEVEAIDAMNCYRRLSGMSRASIEASVQEAVEGQADYILANPDATRLLGPAGPSAYLRQSEGEFGFTGETIFDRLDAAGYGFGDPDAVSTRQFLYVVTSGSTVFAADDGSILTGGAAMDALMRQHEWRELALQRSWIDGGYIEVELDNDWWVASDLCEVAPGLCQGSPRVPDSLVGRMYYIVVVHADPPVERSFQPFSYPRIDQVDVPLYSISADLEAFDPVTGTAPQVQISYPISIFGNASDPATADLSATNVYGLEVTASVSDDNGNAYLTTVVHPGDPAEGRYPDGLDLRRSAAVYIDRPFEPGTRYQLVGEITTNEAIYDVRFGFTTATQDPGLESASAARVLRGSVTTSPDDLRHWLGGGSGLTIR